MLRSGSYALILAGGRGTRFWPRSRIRSAKQVLRLFGARTLIQQTADRLRPVFPPERIWILTNDHLRGEIVRQLPEVPRRQILAEPAQRNTAPAIGLAAHLLAARDPSAVMAVFPADHIIGRPAPFLKLVRAALRSAAEGKMAVLGIQPRWPETGYGYLEFPGRLQPGRLEPAPVHRFREKPDLETAERYLAGGNHFWNAGMFFWSARVFLDALRRYLPRTASLLASLPPPESRGFASALRQTYPLCENISVDYAVLEKAPGVVGFAAGDIGWNDVGSWNAVYELHRRDADGNVALADAIFHGSRGNYVDVRDRFVALVGVDGLVVVDTPDALLIAARARAQEVGAVVKALEKRKRDELL